MGRRLPPFAAVRAFEAAARRGSFTEAAQELNVTQSAISHQVKRLEEFIGVRLFERAPRGLTLTPAGRTYLRDLTDILERLDASTRQLGGRDRPDLLRIRATPAFITRWLLPRLRGFQSDYPDLDYDIAIGFPPTDFSQGDVDIFIHWGTSPVAGAWVEPFFRTTRSPVASREFLRNAPEISRPEDLLSFTRLHDKIQDGWSEWFQSCGVVPPATQRGPIFAHCELALQAAEAGQGVALAYLALIEADLQSGHLVRLFDHETPPVIIYALAYQEREAHKPKIRAFRDWLFREVQGSSPPLRVVASGGLG